MWSLGCLLYVLMAARPPFWDVDRKERERRACREPLNLAADPYL